MKYTRENIQEGIIAKINSLNELSEASKRVYRTVLIDYPIEVEQNVLEWINDLPITEVDCHGESIKNVMNVLGLDVTWFPSILKNFISFKHTNFLLYNTIYEGLC